MNQSIKVRNINCRKFNPILIFELIPFIIGSHIYNKNLFFSILCGQPPSLTFWDKQPQKFSVLFLSVRLNFYK
ncbi:hypothetical protein BpHYR1_002713 [Brachionus plicatilis]|uniref:Uncharacterized protein n=1 Tax=Brachionus plicatilis TaxID=10195 RepID=A0A3M7QHL9_BRAPC|nr:hypothetical protein BpHYR1_002713 [Brachionus plicatilis]